MRLTSSLAFAGLLASAAATFVTFEPSVTLYAPAVNGTCSNQPSVTLTGIRTCASPHTHARGVLRCAHGAPRECATRYVTHGA